MVPVLVQLGPVTIYSFGAMMALGFLMSGFVVAVVLADNGLDPEEAWSIILWAAVGGVLGARVLAILTEWHTFWLHPVSSSVPSNSFILAF